jgi:3'-phosphoadenosine 5'-phosphosulfate sulfotransferase (PAPS reductase)/FAD synthetase
MQRWKERLPRFIEVKSDQPAQIAHCGYPSDVVPLRYTTIGRAVFQESGFKIQSSHFCCLQNIWQPMHEKMKELGVTQIIRGQRLSDKRSSPVRSGDKADGVEVIFPIENWSREQVMDYLHSVGAEIPAYYAAEQTSRDCWDCTAYLDENVERIRRLPEHMKSVVLGRLAEIKSAIAAESEPIFTLSGASKNAGQ